MPLRTYRKQPWWNWSTVVFEVYGWLTIVGWSIDAAVINPGQYQFSSYTLLENLLPGTTWSLLIGIACALQLFSLSFNSRWLRIFALIPMAFFWLLLCSSYILYDPHRPGLPLYGMLALTYCYCIMRQCFLLTRQGRKIFLTKREDSDIIPTQGEEEC